MGGGGPGLRDSRLPRDFAQAWDPGDKELPGHVVFGPAVWLLAAPVALETCCPRAPGRAVRHEQGWAQCGRGALRGGAGSQRSPGGLGRPERCTFTGRRARQLPAPNKPSLAPRGAEGPPPGLLSCWPQLPPGTHPASAWGAGAAWPCPPAVQQGGGGGLGWAAAPAVACWAGVLWERLWVRLEAQKVMGWGPHSGEPL